MTRDSEDDATRDKAVLIYSPPGFHRTQRPGSGPQAPPLRYRCSGKKEGGATSKQSFSELQVTSKGPIYSYVTAARPDAPPAGEKTVSWYLNSRNFDGKGRWGEQRCEVCAAGLLSEFPLANLLLWPGLGMRARGQAAEEHIIAGQQVGHCVICAWCRVWACEVFTRSDAGASYKG